MFSIDLEDFLWLSDWDGEDVGYDDVLIVGLYQLKFTNVYFYIDMETYEVLEYWSEDDE